MVHQIIGYFGAFLFAICAVPQVVKTWKTKKAGDLSLLFLLFWFFGELLTFTYIIVDDLLLGITHYPLYINYLFNIVLVSYLLYAKKYYID
ncbi:MAG: hypothetical protein COV29_02870 [Candidatus Yanofskybacteria bacterium CG10_big_fil_rev_8_21_14_0_10_36_16]|uniref:PQ-loop repeat-containing protein n=1 Tax=Candidatus Yanofskybacteria bacterium CG10_big_fil_rev_8_21_14_0_10_36_16 TaxID=1975096 RepID=A0A2J0Q7Y4_9BACT|nr:MAG: hypothetical protein COV29_02870 [Candidatus Yanofskybacteria bacterium CG10_big_fil_rev_8_21_14_0_10_36_16]